MKKLTTDEHGWTRMGGERKGRSGPKGEHRTRIQKKTAGVKEDRRGQNAVFSLVTSTGIGKVFVGSGRPQNL